jgi:hypothetical protein
MCGLEEHHWVSVNCVGCVSSVGAVFRLAAAGSALVASLQSSTAGGGGTTAGMVSTRER